MLPSQQSPLLWKKKNLGYLNTFQVNIYSQISVNSFAEFAIYR